MEKKLINLYPADHWQISTPVGNGTLGASVYGATYDERILINHEALYNWCCNEPLPDLSDKLPYLRSLMDQKRYKEANDYYTDLIKETGFRSNKGKFFPAFDLHLIFDSQGAPCDYKRQLDMENGVCTVSYTENGEECVRTVFCSMTDGYVVVNLKKSVPFSVKATLERHDMSDYVDSWYGDEFKTFAKDEYIYSESITAGKLHFSGIVKVLNTDGEISSKEKEKKLNLDMSGDVKLESFIEIKNAKEVTFILDVSKRVQPFEKMKGRIDKCTLSFDELLKKHTRKFSRIFNSTRLTLSKCKNKSTEELLLKGYGGKIDNMLIEKMADFGRYLLISCSLDCKFPANLQGMWNGAYSPAWACTFFNNENIQMAYWQACAGGLSKALLPLFNLYESFLDDYRENARRLYGCRGLLLPLFMDNGNGFKENIQPHVLYWTGSSAWICQIYYDYYLYTGDERFLIERAYPFMKECALFYEDFLVYDENGKLKSYPSNSPENRADGDFEGARELSVCINATMDFALVKELLTNLVSVAENHGIDEEKRDTWSKMLSAIPEYEINEDGAIKEYMHPDFKDNYHHRHQSHIYPLFPGFEINEESNKELFEAMRVAVEKRLCIGLKSQTGWSLSHMSNIYARLNDGERAKECLDLLLRFCTGQNLYTHHNDWRNMGVTLKFLHAGHPPFQIDANMGFTSAVYEMLVYSDLDKIKLLPALPSELKSGRIENVHCRGGFVVTISWNENKVSAKIKATRDGEVNVGLKGYKLISNENVSQGKYDGYCLISLKKGQSVCLNYAKNQ